MQIGNAEMIGNNIFKNIDLLSGFAYDENRIQSVDMLYVFTEKGYIRGTIYGDIVEA